MGSKDARKHIIGLLALLLLFLMTRSALAHLNPTLGRFIQNDPLGYTDGMNGYMYARNCPGEWHDPSGKASVTIETTNHEYTVDSKLPDDGKVTLPTGTIGKVQVLADVETTYLDKKKNMVGGGWHEIVVKLTGAKDCDQCRWLQFYKVERKDKNGTVAGVYNTGVGYYRYGDTYVDSNHPTDPFYDARGVNELTSVTSAIADKPTIMELNNRDNGLGIIEKRGVFDDFLICHTPQFGGALGDAVMYSVHWERARRSTATGGWETKYENVSGGPTSTLPEWASGDKLSSGFTDSALMHEQPPYDNPVPQRNR